MKQSHRCQCFDPGCKIGHDSQCKEACSTTLYRVDTDDTSGTRFCEGCADDAAGSGLFTEVTDDEDAEIEEMQFSILRDSRETLARAEAEWEEGR